MLVLTSAQVAVMYELSLDLMPGQLLRARAIDRPEEDGPTTNGLCVETVDEQGAVAGDVTLLDVEGHPWARRRRPGEIAPDDTYASLPFGHPVEGRQALREGLPVGAVLRRT